MSSVLEKHRTRLNEALVASRASIVEIEADIRLRAMSKDVSEGEVAFLRRLKEETSKEIYRLENLDAAFRAILGNVQAAAE